MSALSDYLEAKFADHALGTATFTPGATLTLKLYTSAPSDSAGGTEVSGGSYAAITISNNTANFPQCATTGTPTKTNGSIFQFPVATAPWGTVSFWALWSGTDLYAYGPVSPGNYVSTGDSPKFNVGQLSIQLLNGSGGGLTESVRRNLLDLAFGQVAYSKPSAVYAAAGTSLSGETLTEWTDANYVRPAITFGAASVGAGTATSTNTQTLCADAGTGGYTINSFGIFDDPISGSLIASGPVSTPRTPAEHEILRFNTGEIILTMQ